MYVPAKGCPEPVPPLKNRPRRQPTTLQPIARYGDRAMTSDFGLFRGKKRPVLRLHERRGAQIASSAKASHQRS